jgi:hypothetical protein
MTEPTTTEIVERMLSLYEDMGGEEAHEVADKFIDLNNALTSGSPLPEQWPQAQEIATLRQRLADRETVAGWAARYPEFYRVVIGFRMDGAVAIPLVSLASTVEIEKDVFVKKFYGKDSIDEAFSAAAEWVRKR